MNELGSISLLGALTLSVFALCCSIWLSFRSPGRARAIEWARRMTIASGVLCAVSFGALSSEFLQSNFSNQYVWQFSNRAMDDIYKLTAVWGGMDGSMLLWCFFLSIATIFSLLPFYRYPAKGRAWLLVFENLTLSFFLVVITLFTNPFRYIRAPFIPPDGNGLNPLLQNPYMAIHPPILYAGFVTLAIPFALYMAALASGDLSARWLSPTKRWGLISWSFLTTGICLGGYWAYIELGWGGFWAWDPVENASFLPWLSLTAFLHSILTQERKGMLKLWNVWLIVLSFGLTVFGTFLTRSGIVQSVHAFASTDIGWVFLTFLGIIFVIAVVLTWKRRELLRPERSLESVFSREAAFLVNNLLLLTILFATIWGVMFPVFSEAFFGEKQTVGIPFFNTVNVPLFLLLLLFMGIGPLLSWRGTSFSAMVRTLVGPALFAFLSAGVLLWAGVRGFYPVTAYGLCAFVVATIMVEMHRGVRRQRAALPNEALPQSLGRLARRHPSRVGGHIVHLGVVIAALGITASMAHKVEREFSISAGEHYEIGDIQVALSDFGESHRPNYEALYAHIDLVNAQSGKVFSQLNPELRFYTRNGETTSEVALFRSLKRDIYVVLAGLDETGTRASFKVFINPLQGFLWLGVAIMVLGSGFILVMRRLAQETLITESASSRAVLLKE